jgi:hypothetical protein
VSSITERIKDILNAWRGWTARRAAWPAMAALLLAASSASTAELEPRAYVNTPPGVNFLIAGYAYSSGGLSTASSSPLQDARLDMHTAVLAYARSMDFWGKSGKFDVIVPWSDLSGTALVNGSPRSRQVSGFNDPRFRLSVNFFGAPALSLEDFAKYQPDLLVGVSVQVSAPLGQYDPDKMVNLGSNRWFVKPDMGVSKAWGPWTLELSGGVTFYTRNDDYFGGKTLEQDPLYSTQAHLTRDLGLGAWGALDATYDYGGRTTVDGVRNSDLQGNSRAGATLALPVNRNNSVKLHASTGVTTRAGNDYDLAMAMWQYRWW